MTEPTLPPLIEFQALAAAEAAAIAASAETGRGDNKRADQVAVDAMRQALNALPISGTVVIGEGERDEAPMLYIGEKVGRGGPAIDIALDPLEGTTITAHGGAGALAVLAFAGAGGFLNAPDVYMDKIAVGPAIPPGTVDLDLSVEDNLRAVAEVLGIPVTQVTVCLLDRPRHADKIAAIRAAGARAFLIGDGDVAGVMGVSLPDSPIDLYMGSGGAPEGVLAAAALRTIGGDIQGRLLFRNDAERARAERWGITDLNRKYGLHELARGPVLFVATGVTTGGLLAGVESHEGGCTTQSLVLRSDTGVVRTIITEHPGAGTP